MCFSTQDYNKWMNEHYSNNNDDDDDEKLIPKWFCLSYCDEEETYRDFTDKICHQPRLHVIILRKILKRLVIKKKDV